MRFILMMAVVFALALTGATGQTKDTACSISAYVNDSDPAGLNVRSGAGKTFKAIGSIPFNDEGTAVDIIASRGKWVKIATARNAEGDKVFSKAGWVFAPSLSVSTKGAAASEVKAFASASSTGKTVTILPVDSPYPLEACQGSWAKISLPGSIFGWLGPTSYCGNPWNSCS